MPITQESVDEMEKAKILDGDGTAPKAVPEDTSAIGEDGTPLSPKDHGGVKFISPSRASGNGDAKVELGGVGAIPQFVGLGKEELMRYANDPFWVRLRWFLFILFWLIWLGMLAAAIAIIVMAPKCASTANVAKHLADKGPFYEIDLASVTGVDKFAGLKSHVSYIADLGMRTVIISQFQRPNDLNQIQTGDFGSETSLEELLDAFKAKEIRVLFKLSPNHVGKDYSWSEEEKKMYFVIKDAAETNKSTWKSVYGEPAWSPYGDETKNYLHQFRQSEIDLNYNNDDVAKEMNSILRRWFKFNNGTGIYGFLLSDVSYLTEDFSQLDKQEATINQAGNKAVLEKILDSSGWELGPRAAPYALLDVDGLDAAQSLLKYTGDAMIPVVTDLSSHLKSNFTAEDLDSHVKSINQNFVIRRLSGQRLGRITEKFSPERADILATVAFLLRGEIIVYYGEEIDGDGHVHGAGEPHVERMQWTPDSSGSKISNFYTCLGNVHKSITQMDVLDDSGAQYAVYNKTFLFKRNDKYVVVANLGDEEVNLDLPGKFEKLPTNGTLRCATPNVVVALDSEVISTSFKAAATSAYVLAF